MSDIRTKLLLGTTMGALAMMFVMAVGVDAFDTTTTTAVQPGVLMGHATVMAVHPDGSMSYSQGDNAIIAGGLVPAITQLMDGTVAVAGNVFNCVRIGTGAPGAPSGNVGAGAITLLPTTTAQNCDGAATTANAGGAATINTSFTIVGTDVAPVNTGTVTIQEALLEDATGSPGGADVLSHVVLAAPVGAITGTVVSIAFTLTLS